MNVVVCGDWLHSSLSCPCPAHSHLARPYTLILARRETVNRTEVYSVVHKVTRSRP